MEPSTRTFKKINFTESQTQDLIGRSENAVPQAYPADNATPTDRKIINRGPVQAT